MLPIYKNSRILLCLLSTIYIFVYLIFEHFTTGVQGHYPFHDDSLPFISNWWGIIVVPLVTFCLTTLLTKHYGELYPRQVWIHLAGGGLYAAINAVLFFSGNVELLSALVLPSVVILALFFQFIDLIMCWVTISYQRLVSARLSRLSAALFLQ